MPVYIQFKTVIVTDPYWPCFTWVYFVDPEHAEYIGGWLDNY